MNRVLHATIVLSLAVPGIPGIQGMTWVAGVGGVAGAVTAPASARADEIQEIFGLFMQGELVEAEERSRAYVAAHPDDAAGFHALGRICLARGQGEEAIKHLTRCLELEPAPAWMVAWSHVALGQAFLATGDEDAARIHLEKAVALNATRNCTQLAQRVLAELDGVPVPEAAAEPDSPWVGKPMPDFTFHGLAGETIKPEQTRGRVCLYKFGPTW